MAIVESNAGKWSLLPLLISNYLPLLLCVCLSVMCMFVSNAYQILTADKHTTNFLHNRLPFVKGNDDKHTTNFLS